VDCHDAVEVSEALASREPARFVAGVRALAEAVRAGDWYEVPKPPLDALPGFLGEADPDAAADLLYVLEAHGFFVPPATRADLWRWGGAVVAVVGGSRVGHALAVQVRCADDSSEALGAVLGSVDSVTHRPWAPAGLSTFLEMILSDPGPLRDAAILALRPRARGVAWGPHARTALSRAGIAEDP